jgi:hypothetical protein
MSMREGIEGTNGMPPAETDLVREARFRAAKRLAEFFGHIRNPQEVTFHKGTTLLHSGHPAMALAARDLGLIESGSSDLSPRDLVQEGKKQYWNQEQLVNINDSPLVRTSSNRDLGLRLEVAMSAIARTAMENSLVPILPFYDEEPTDPQLAPYYGFYNLDQQAVITDKVGDLPPDPSYVREEKIRKLLNMSNEDFERFKQRMEFTSIIARDPASGKRQSYLRPQTVTEIIKSRLHR